MANLENLANEAEAILAQIVAAGEAREAAGTDQGTRTIARAGEDIASIRKAAESSRDRPQDPETWGAILKAADRHPYIASQVAAFQPRQAPDADEPVEATIAPPAPSPVQQASAPPSQASPRPAQPQSVGQRIGTAAQSFIGMVRNPMSIGYHLPQFIQSMAGLAAGGGTAASGAASAGAAAASAGGAVGAGATGAGAAAGGTAAAGAAASAVAAPVAAALAAAYAIKQATMGAVAASSPFMGKTEHQVATGMADSASNAALFGPLGMTYELTQLPKHITEWDEALLSSKRGLAQFSGALNRYFAEAERREIVRGVESAQATGGSLSTLGEKWQDLQDELRPLKDTITTHLAAILTLGTAMLRGLNMVIQWSPAFIALKKAADAYEAANRKEAATTFGTIMNEFRKAGATSTRAPRR